MRQESGRGAKIRQRAVGTLKRLPDASRLTYWVIQCSRLPLGQGERDVDFDEATQ